MSRLAVNLGAARGVLVFAALVGLGPGGAGAGPARTRVGTHGSTSSLTLGCDDCHSLHAAPGGWGPSGGENSDWSCLDCHGTRRSYTAFGRSRTEGRPAALSADDIEAEFRKPSAHPLTASAGRALRRPRATALSPRTAADLFTGDERTGTSCTDCHDPHARTGPAPTGQTSASAASGGHQLLGASGASIDEQDFCYGCHGSGPRDRGSRPGRRSIEALLLPDNPSAHPVDWARTGPGLPGLLPRPGAGPRMSCSDCHGSDDEAGPQGPHGSVHAPLLKARYNQDIGQAESPSQYALCYSCHDRGRLLSPLSGFPLHASHVVTARASCSDCHDAHGSVEHDHLLDFAPELVSANSEGRVGFDEGLEAGGTCSMTCHEKDHVESPY